MDKKTIEKRINEIITKRENFIDRHLDKEKVVKFCESTGELKQSFINYICERITPKTQASQIRNDLESLSFDSRITCPCCGAIGSDIKINIDEAYCICKRDGHKFTIKNNKVILEYQDGWLEYSSLKEPRYKYVTEAPYEDWLRIKPLIPIIGKSVDDWYKKNELEKKKKKLEKLTGKLVKLTGEPMQNEVKNENNPPKDLEKEEKTKENKNNHSVE